jgi:DNA invertase Pin-like site-specific DNA recombinase
MASVAELEAGMIGERTKRALAAAKDPVRSSAASAAGLQPPMTVPARAQR